MFYDKSERNANVIFWVATPSRRCKCTGPSSKCLLRIWSRTIATFCYRVTGLV